MKKIIMMILVLITLVGCASYPTESPIRDVPNDDIKIFDSLSNGVFRFIDKEAGVVCWTVYQNGISCLPIGETKLR
jgi:hypothetical protein